jgi:hypothetical protein
MRQSSMFLIIKAQINSEFGDRPSFAIIELLHDLQGYYLDIRKSSTKAFKIGATSIQFRCDNMYMMGRVEDIWMNWLEYHAEKEGYFFTDGIPKMLSEESLMKRDLYVYLELLSLKVCHDRWITWEGYINNTHMTAYTHEVEIDKVIEQCSRISGGALQEV